jgi:hypothetical protein
MSIRVWGKIADVPVANGRTSILTSRGKRSCLAVYRHSMSGKRPAGTCRSGIAPTWACSWAAVAVAAAAVAAAATAAKAAAVAAAMAAAAVAAAAMAAAMAAAAGCGGGDGDDVCV